ncbi:MAG: peptide ABC transporter substrate-binding protein [Gammaproteobacteria bacterium]|nr:peptide ABC transporter substrate-binding protein [Gammaproteobacteria bacterium]
MSEIVSDTEDAFARTAGRQLLWLGLASILALTALMFALGWLSQLTASGTLTGEAVDIEARSISLAMTGEPPQLDSTRATDQVSGFVLGHVMEGLLRYDAHNNLSPGVAERWQIEPDGATFWLRADAKWSDGKPVTAHDFIFAWRRVLDPATASEYAFILFPIKNGEAINAGALPVTALGVKALDDRTLQIEFERPIAYFDKLVAFATYLPVRQDFFDSRNGRYGADADDLLYNGPFTITRWVHSASLRFEKNSEYWNRDAIALNVIDVPYITPDANATLNLYKDGKIAVTTLNSDTLENALDQRWKLERFNDGSVFFLEFNYRPGRITANYNVRRALQLVTDSGELVYKVMKLPGNLPGETLFPIWLKGVNGLFRQEYPPRVHTVDVAAARRHLELATAELGIEKLPPLVLLTGDDPLSNKQAEYFQNVYSRQLGLEVKIDKQIFKQRLAKMTAGDFDMVMAGWGPDFADPLTFGDLFSSWNLNNRGRYSNPELDGAVRTAQNSMDPKVRMDAFGDIQRIIYDDAVILPNYERGVVFVRDPRLKGMVRRAVGTDPDYTAAYVAED